MHSCLSPLLSHCPHFTPGHQMCRGSFHAETIIWVAYHLTLSLRGDSFRSHRLKTQSHKTAPLSDVSRKSQVVICTSDQLTVNQVSHDPLIRFNNLLEWFTKIRGNTFIGLLYNKGMIKDTDEQPDEEMHRVHCRRVLCAKLLSPGSLSEPLPPSQHMDVFTNG